jgi:hypothetical protein
MGTADYGSPEGINALRWWLPEFKGDKRRADACGSWLTRAMLRHDVRRRVALFNAQLYEDVPALGLGPFQYAVYDLGSPRLRMNLIRAVSNTYCSLVSRSKPKPRFLTSNGDPSLRKRAKGLTKWYEGKNEELQLYKELSGPCCLDSGVFGRGLAKIYTQWPDRKDLTDVGVERTFSWELVADDAESQIPSRMKNLAHRKWYDRSVAMEMFPKSKREIAGAPRNDSRGMMRDWTIDSAADLVALSELWHLPTWCDSKGDTSGDGLHVIMIEGKILYEGPWERSTFPFAFLYRDRPSMGIYGTSIPHELRGLHVDINQTLLDIQDCLRLNGKPRIMAPLGSFEKDAWDDDVDSILEYTGQVQPTLYSPQVMPPEQYQFLWAKWAKGFEMIGVSEDQSKGNIPEGLSGSGESIREWNDVKDGRLYQPSVNFEDFHMDIFRLMADEARSIAKVNPHYASAYRGKTYVEIVKFKEVDLGKDAFFMNVFPESRLSKNPSQRQAQLQELLNGGIITPEEFRDKLDFPDLDAESDLANVPRRLADDLIAKFLEAEDPEASDVFVYPEPEWPLEIIKTRMRLALAGAYIDKVPEGNKRLMRQFIQLCDKLAPKPPMSAAGPGGPTPTHPGGQPPMLNGGSPTVQLNS